MPALPCLFVENRFEPEIYNALDTSSRVQPDDAVMTDPSAPSFALNGFDSSILRSHTAFLSQVALLQINMYFATIFNVITAVLQANVVFLVTLMNLRIICGSPGWTGIGRRSCKILVGELTSVLDKIIACGSASLLKLFICRVRRSADFNYVSHHCQVLSPWLANAVDDRKLRNMK